MSDTVGVIVSSYRKTHGLVLKLAADLTDEQLSYEPNTTTPPIAFHLWHLARYADSLPDQLGLEGGMIWRDEGLATQWGFRSETLGIYESGTGMDAEVPGQLPWPDKDALVAYCRRAFEAADDAVGLLDSDRLQHAAKWGGRSIGTALMTNLEHDNRHLGMIECMLGVMGQQGSASS